MKTFTISKQKKMNLTFCDWAQNEISLTISINEWDWIVEREPLE